MDVWEKLQILSAAARYDVSCCTSGVARGGAAGGRIVACGTPEEIRENKESITGSFI